MSKTLKELSLTHVKLGGLYLKLATENRGKSCEAEESDAVEETTDGDESSEESDEDTQYPSADEITKMKRADMVKLAKSINLPTEGLESSELREHLLTVASLTEGEDIEEERLNSLAILVGITPDKKSCAKTLQELEDYFTNESSDSEEDSEEESDDDDSEEEDSEEEDSEEDSEEESEEENSEEEESNDDDDDSEEEESEEDDSEEDSEEEDEEEKPASKKSGKAKAKEESDEDDDDSEEEVSEKEMVSRLKAYNAVAKKKIEVAKGKVKLAYSKLKDLLTDDEGNVSKWGTPYVRQETGWNCGKELSELPEKKGNPRGKCAVTGKVFVYKNGKFVAE